MVRQTLQELSARDQLQTPSLQLDRRAFLERGPWNVWTTTPCYHLFCKQRFVSVGLDGLPNCGPTLPRSQNPPHPEWGLWPGSLGSTGESAGNADSVWDPTFPLRSRLHIAVRAAEHKSSHVRVV